MLPLSSLGAVKILIIGYLMFPLKKGTQKVNHIPWYDWIIMIAAGFAHLIPGTLTDVGGIAVVVLVVAFQYMRKKKQN